MKFLNLIIVPITLLFFSCSSYSSEASAPVKVLYLTGGYYHTYDTQEEIIKQFIPHHINANVDTRKDFKNFADPSLADNYDFILINFCFAESKNQKIIDNLIRIVKNGKSALVVHGTMHTFRDAKEITNKWAKFLGVYSRRHDPKKGYTVTKINNHPIVKKLPQKWEVNPGELYRVISTNKNITAITESYSTKTKTNHVSTWKHNLGKGTVFGTTIGHFDSIYKNKNFQKLITNIILAGTDKLDNNGKPISGYLGHQKTLDFSHIKVNPKKHKKK